MIVVFIIFTMCITVAVHVTAMAAGGWLVGAPIEEISLFSGKKLIRTKFGDTKFSVGFIPFGGFVKFDDAFQKIHPLKRVFVATCGCMALVFLAAVVFGSSEALRKFLIGFYQIVSGAFAPRSTGSQLLRAFYEYVRNNSFTLCVGLVATKLAAFNLLPLPVLNGGDITLAILNWIKPIPEKVRERIQMIGFIIVLLIGLLWIVAFVHSLVSR